MTQVVVIGAGITGLAAAYVLGKAGCRVTVLEADATTGGLAASHTMDGFTIERHYHHLFSTDAALFSLMRELGVEKSLVWNRASVGYRIGGKNYPLDTPRDILAFSPLTFADKARLALLVKRSPRIRDFKALDRTVAREWLLPQVGERVYRSFFLPLQMGKFGDAHDEISAAWMAQRIALRSNRSTRGETLAYLAEGFAPFIQRLEAAVVERGGAIRAGEPVTRIIVEGGRARGAVTAKGEVRADAVIATVTPESLLRLAPVPDGFAAAIRSIPLQGTVCLAVGARRGVLDGIYWLNMDEPTLPFRLLLEHTNFYRHSAYPPAILYLASYTQAASDPLMTAPGEEVTASFLNGLRRVFGLSPADVLWTRLARDRVTAVVYTVGSMDRVPPMSTPIAGLTWAGIVHAYPERSINKSVELGTAAANLALGRESAWTS